MNLAREQITVDISEPDCDQHSSSEEYAKRFSGSIGEYFLDRQWQIVSKLLAESYPSKTDSFSILDVGGGHAQILASFDYSHAEYTVLGTHLNCVGRIQRFLQSGKCKFVTGSFYKLPFADNSFDVVISLRQVAHVPDTQRFIQELARVAKQVVIIDYAPLCSLNVLSPVLFQIKKRIEKNTRTFLVHKDSEIKRFFHSNKFNVSNRIAQFFFPMGIHRFMKDRSKSEFLEKIAERFGLTKYLGSPTIVNAVKIVDRS